MRLGMVGLGRMGGNMATRLLRGGHEVVGWAPEADAITSLIEQGGIGAASLDDLLAQLPAPRSVWLMVPAGVVDQVLESLRPQLQPGDLVVDGGNSNYKETLRRAEELRLQDIHYVDAGTSGGVWGLDEGYSLMVGGDVAAVDRLAPALATLAPGPARGWARVGPVGAGHFVKMVHNGIEYGLMQAYAEGFALLQRKQDFDLDLAQVAEIWRHGSVVRSWLLDLTARALDDPAGLAALAPHVADSGEGRWTVAEAIDLDCPAPVITAALLARLASRDTDSFSHKLLAALRQQFGGHAVQHKEGAG